MEIPGISITDSEHALILADIGEGATDEQVTALVQQGGRLLVDQIVARQTQYQLDRAVVRVKELLVKLVQLSVEQQTEVQTIAEAAIDERLAANQLG